ncbi:hypothetical protein EBZ37_11615, partial [bacterium]|nr:hypothetical protein [bacterium]
MRRTRVFSIIQYVLIALPVIGSAWGLRYLITHPKGTHSELKQSKNETKKSKARSKREKEDESSVFAANAQKKLSHPMESEDEAEEQETASNENEHSPAGGNSASVADAPKENECRYVEYKGFGPVDTKITKGQWALVMDQFHDAKAKLLSWLVAHKAEFSVAQFELMEKQIKKLKIQRPPAEEEPDLAWRGVGVHTQARDGVDPILRVGGGVVTLVEQDPARARFEFVRWVAAAWSPCELSRVAGANPWGPMLSCLGVSDSSCAAGSFSEAGWAVTTTVAASL